MSTSCLALALSVVLDPPLSANLTLSTTSCVYDDGDEEDFTADEVDKYFRIWKKYKHKDHGTDD